MKKKLVWFSVLMGVSGLFWASPVQAIFLDFAPVSQTVGVGELVTVDVVISELDAEIVSAFDLDVTYDPSILSATDVSFGTFLNDGLPFLSLQDFDLSTPGVVDFAELSFLSDFELDLLQPDSFTLATLSFDTLAVGTSLLAYVLDDVNDVKGLNAQVLDLTARSGSISPVPEPGTLLLMGAGLAGMAGLRRKRLGKKVGEAPTERRGLTGA